LTQEEEEEGSVGGGTWKDGEGKPREGGRIGSRSEGVGTKQNEHGAHQSESTLQLVRSMIEKGMRDR
jgi:hypothetical protein